jgi:hypothetical protein
MRSILSLVATIALLFNVADVNAFRRGLPWATDNRRAPTLGNLPKILWYHHWADGPVPEMPSKVEYVPMFWGPSSWSKWNSRLYEMRQRTPKHLMAFNEPDISSQANMNPYYAAQLYMEQIYPWAAKGTQLGSPAIAYNLDWMATFLSEVSKRGGHVDFICIHWYGSWKDINSFKNYVMAAHNRFGKPIWVTELGITTASWPSSGQVKTFMQQAFIWMESQPYVWRAAWFGAWSTPPDGFASAKNALFTNTGGLNDRSYWYGYSSWWKRSGFARHHIARDEEARDEETRDAQPAEVVDCDEICQLRNAQVASWLQATTDTPAVGNTTTDAV